MSGVLRVRGDLTDPRNETIRAYQHGTQAQRILNVSRDISDPPNPAACKRLQRCTSIKVQEQAATRPQEIADPRPVGQLEVRNAAADERMIAAEIIA